METTDQGGFQGHCVWIKSEPEENLPSAPEDSEINEPRELSDLKGELTMDDPTNNKNNSVIENLQETNVILQEPTSSPRTASRLETSDQLASQPDSTCESFSTTQQLNVRHEVYFKSEFDVDIDNDSLAPAQETSLPGNDSSTSSNQTSTAIVTSPITCQLTGQKSPSISVTFEPQQIKHSENQTHRCDVCCKIFKTSQCLKIHKEFTCVRFTCGHCNVIFPGKLAMKSHIIWEHIQGGVRVRYPCNICQKTFYDKSTVREHFKRLHSVRSDADVRFPCSLCTKTYKDKRTLNAHIRRHDPSGGIIRFPCTICDKTFYDKSTLSKHLKRHESQRFQCDICDFQCAALSSLKAHIALNHKGVRRFDCKICGNDYMTLEELKMHKRVHLDPFKCPTCHVRFLSKDRLDWHVNGKHSTKEVSCDICSKSFPSQRNLQQHLLVHTKPVKCDVCGEGFTRSDFLRRHKSKCHGIAPQCDPTPIVVEMSSPSSSTRFVPFSSFPSPI